MSVVRDGPSSRVPLFVGYRVAGAVRLRTSALSPMRNEFVTCCTVACRPSISFATSLLASSSAPLAMPWFPAPFPSSLPASPPLQCLGSRLPFPQACRHLRPCNALVPGSPFLNVAVCLRSIFPVMPSGALFSLQRCGLPPPAFPARPGAYPSSGVLPAHSGFCDTLSVVFRPFGSTASRA